METTDLNPDRQLLLSYLGPDERIVHAHGHHPCDRHGLDCPAAMRGAAAVENGTAVAS